MRIRHPQKRNGIKSGFLPTNIYLFHYGKLTFRGICLQQRNRRQKALNNQCYVILFQIIRVITPPSEGHRMLLTRRQITEFSDIDLEEDNNDKEKVRNEFKEDKNNLRIL